MADLVIWKFEDLKVGFAGKRISWQIGKRQIGKWSDIPGSGVGKSVAFYPAQSPGQVVPYCAYLVKN